MLSTFESVYPSSEWERLSKKKWLKSHGLHLHINKFMSGVDLLYSLLSLYRIQIRLKKWYHKLLFYSFLIWLLSSAGFSTVEVSSILVKSYATSKCRFNVFSSSSPWSVKKRTSISSKCWTGIVSYSNRPIASLGNPRA